MNDSTPFYDDNSATGYCVLCEMVTGWDAFGINNDVFGYKCCRCGTFDCAFELCRLRLSKWKEKVESKEKSLVSKIN